MEVPEGEEEKGMQEISIIIIAENFPKFQTTDIESSENTNQCKYKRKKKNQHLGNQRQRENLDESRRGKNILLIEEQG